MAKGQTFEEWMQSRLTAHGFPVGPIDGLVGPITIAALKRFQKAQKIEVTGRADALTVARLQQSASVLVDAPARVDTPDMSVSPKLIWPKQNAVTAFYGAVGTNQTQIQLPYEMRLAWDKRRKISKITVHQKVAASAKRCFDRIHAAYNQKQILDLGLDLFGGSLNVRKMRGGSAYSMHSWGIAIDFDPERNQLNWGRDRARLAQPDANAFWEIWEDEGWLSLGRARNFDWQHIQAARL